MRRFRPFSGGAFFPSQYADPSSERWNPGRRPHLLVAVQNPGHMWTVTSWCMLGCSGTRAYAVETATRVATPLHFVVVLNSCLGICPRDRLMNKTSGCGSLGWAVSWLGAYFTSRIVIRSTQQAEIHGLSKQL
ncbi:unnamed protein product [Dibothriocephalus latus]|uniref:Uncharacterized protein n=1 Tax=Dibothriocephalus latus TaxID=60516 RepID=A0A3P7NZH0_DIBLA|nr:unnamed protein product [Dibothriocephalus latus]